MTWTAFRNLAAAVLVAIVAFGGAPQLAGAQGILDRIKRTADAAAKKAEEAAKKAEEAKKAAEAAKRIAEPEAKAGEKEKTTPAVPGGGSPQANSPTAATTASPGAPGGANPVAAQTATPAALSGVKSSAKVESEVLLPLEPGQPLDYDISPKGHHVAAIMPRGSRQV